MNIVGKLLETIIEMFFAIFFRIKGESKISKKLRQTVSLYKTDGFGKLFSEIRSWDAPYEDLEKVVPKVGRILDLGCGDGLLANYLALASSRRIVTGIELNAGRLKIADKGLKNTRFVRGDIIKVKYPKSDSVVLAHVLHHLPSKASQEMVLKKITKMLVPKSKLIILEIDEKPFLKYIFSVLVDMVVVPILFERKFFSSKVFYRTWDEWSKLLKKLGYKTEVKTIHKGMPFSHILIIASKE